MKMQERCRNSWRTRPSRDCGRTGTTSLSMTASKASPSSARRRAFQATKRRAGKNAHSRSKRGTLATLDRERPWVHGTMPLTCSRGSSSLCGICSKQHLTLAMMQILPPTYNVPPGGCSDINCQIVTQEYHPFLCC